MPGSTGGSGFDRLGANKKKTPESSSKVVPLFDETQTKAVLERFARAQALALEHERVAREEAKRDQQEERPEPTIDELAVVANEIVDQKTPTADMEVVLGFVQALKQGSPDPLSYAPALAYAPDEIPTGEQSYYRSVAIAFLELKAELERYQHPEV